MDNFIRILRDANSPEELEQYKVMLFKENVRLRTDISELEELQDQMRIDRRKFAEEKKAIEQSRIELEHDKELVFKELEEERKRLEQDKVFFDKKQMMLDRAFKELDNDRKRIEQERIALNKFRDDVKKQVSKEKKINPVEYKTGVFFRGVSNTFELKKRYKDLIKVFHPDNAGGDNDTLQMINKEYETLKHEMRLF